MRKILNVVLMITVCLGLMVVGGVMTQAVDTETFDINAVYLKGDKVIYNDKTYIAQFWAQGSYPDEYEWDAWLLDDYTIDESLPVLTIEEAESRNIEKFILKENPRLRATTNRSTLTLINNVALKQGVFLGTHPEFTRPDRCDGYYLSSQVTGSIKFSISVKVSKVVSIGVTYQKANSGGRFYKADSNRYSTLGIYGNVIQNTYRMDTYDSMGHKISSSNTTSYSTRVTLYKARY